MEWEIFQHGVSADWNSLLMQPEYGMENEIH